MSKISIPEPCHENWADFTPTEKGAFCGSCQIDVIDFSNKSPNEIKSILHENAGKHMCGRFKKTQLVQLNDDFFAWQNQSARSLQSKFLYACLIVFGMTLFTGCESNQHVVGELYYEEPIEQINEPELPNKSHIEEEAPVEEHNNYKKGKIKVSSEDEITKTCETETNLDEREFTKGDVMFIPDEKEELFLGQPIIHHVEPIETDTLEKKEEIVMGRTAVHYVEPKNPDTTLFTDEMVDGGLMIDPEYFNFLEDTTEAVKQTETNTESLATIAVNPDFEGVLFPNPTSDYAKFQLQVNHSGMYDIYLYAVDGKKIKSIYTGNLSEGLREFNINLKPYESGSYLLIINSDKQKDSFKIEKVK